MCVVGAAGSVAAMSIATTASETGVAPGLPTHPFTSADAAERGVSRRVLARLVVEGSVRRVLNDVYVPMALEDTVDLRAAAAARVLPEHAVVVDSSAAWLWGVDARPSDQLTAVPRLEVFVLPGHKRVTRPEVGGGERDLAPRDVTRVGGVPVTVPVRTALDLACGLRPYDALAALDALARVQGVTVFDMLAQLPRFRGRRGVVQARRLVPLVDARAESSGESFTRLAVVEAGLPAPRPQVWVYDDRGLPRYRLDLAYPELRICLEYDGHAWHSTPQRRAADARRRAWLREQGWVVIVVDKNSFRGTALDAWLHQLRSARAARSR